MTSRLGIAPLRKHRHDVMRFGIVSQPAAAPAHPYTVRCSAESAALCPACGDALAGSLGSRIAAGRVRA